MMLFVDRMLHFRDLVTLSAAAPAAVALLAGCLSGAPADPGPRDGDVDHVARASSTEPDLIVRAVQGPRSAMPGALIEVEVEVCNQGGGYVWTSDVAVFVSEDDVIDAFDPMFGMATIWYLEPGGCQYETVIGPAPSMPGRYLLGAQADVSQYVYEDDETNNTAAGSTLAVGFEPDLVVERVRGPATVEPGGQVAIDVRVCNHGQSYVGGGVGVELYLSADEEVTTADQPIGWFHVYYLEPGRCEDTTTVVNALGDLGAHVLGAIADPYESVFELDEDNNAAAGGALHIGWGPDLVITAIDGPPSAMPYSPVSVSVTVCNQGQAPSPTAEVQLHVSEDDAFDPMFDPPVGYTTLPHIEPGACATARASLSLYYGPPDGIRLGAVVDPWSYVYEIIEDNNTYLGERMGVGYEPDLVVAGVTGAHSSWPFEDFEATARVCNQGQWYSQSTSVRIYVDGMGAPGPGMYPVPSLAPGACANVIGVVFAPGQHGAHLLRAVVDPDDMIIELVESNNAGAGQRVAVGDDADLVVTQVTPPPGVLFHETSVAARVCNHGRVASDPASVRLLASRDAEPSSDDVVLGDGSVSWLAPDACADVSIPAYPGVSEGAYYLIAEVDPFDYVVEILDDNNAGASGVVGIGHSADLVISAITAPASALPGAPFDLAVTVCNRGHMSSPSTDVEISAVFEGENAFFPAPVVVWAPVDYLPPGQCATSHAQAGIDGPDGLYRLRGVVDRWQGVPEVLEGNNELVAGVIGIGHDADLVVTQVSGPPSALPDSFVEVTARVCNQGQSPSSGTSVALYFSANADIGFSGDFVVGWADVGHLAPGDCEDVSVSGYAPWEPGVYVPGAFVDPYYSIAELTKANNTGVGERLGVGWGPDLVVASVSGPPSAQPWSAVEVSARVCNQGQGTSWSAMLDVVLSLDAEVGSGDLVIGEMPVPTLDPGACHDLATTAYLQGSPGAFTLGAVVRADDQPELIEDNNGRAAGLLGVGWDPDLIVAAVTGPASAPAWSEIMVSVQVCNQGQGDSFGTYVEVVLSNDGTVGSDVPVGAGWIDYLAPGACQTVDVPVWPFQPEGSYVLVARVDPYGYVWELIESNNDTAGATIELTP